MHESNKSYMDIPSESFTPGDPASLKRVMKGVMVFALAVLAVIVFGCGMMHTESKVVPITTFNQIEGKWQGLSKRMPDMREHAQVIVTINERGHFNFISDRGDGLALGTGSLTILNGQAMGTTSSGTGTFTLHDRGGRPLLVLEATLNDGHHYFLEMKPMD